MPFTLGDIENDCLANLGSQNPPANYGVGTSTYPVWTSVQGIPRFSQGLIDAAINRSAQKAISDLRYTGLVEYTYTFATMSQVYAYPIPMGSVAQATMSFAGTPVTGKTVTITVAGTPVVYTMTSADTSIAQMVSHIISALNASTLYTAGTITLVSPAINSVNGVVLTSAVNGLAGNALTFTVASNTSSVTVTTSGATFTGGTATNPNLMELRRLQYQPQGQVYRRDELAGIRLVSWEDFSQATGGGYLKQFSFGTEPNLVSLIPSRTSIEFFPGPASTGDLVTLHYVPAMTTGTGQPLLVNQTDVVPLPDDCRDLVLHGAMEIIWPVASEFGMQKTAREARMEEAQRIREQWSHGSSGESQRIIDGDVARCSIGFYP